MRFLIVIVLMLWKNGSKPRASRPEATPTTNPATASTSATMTASSSKSSATDSFLGGAPAGGLRGASSL